MKISLARLVAELLIVVFGLTFDVGCEKQSPEPFHDNPRLTNKLVLQDVTFPSVSLNRPMTYRVVVPRDLRQAEKLPVIYLLHGGGGDFREWTNYSDVAKFAEHRVLLVMPEGNSSYYVNSATNANDRYEDYVVKDLIADVEKRFPVGADRSHRAIAGISMGGFGAVKLALSHPDLFVTAAGISSAIDVPRRPFSIKRVSQWTHHRSIFGPWGSPERRDKDPFVLAKSADPTKTPFLYLTCGEQEGLMPANRQFAALLDKQRIPHIFVPGPGGHDWNQWNRVIPKVFDTLLQHLGAN